MAEKDLESRVKRLEAYIARCKNTKERKWRTSVTGKLDDLKNHLTQQDTEKRREKRVLIGRTIIASSLPVFGVGLASTVHALLIMKAYDFFVTFLTTQEFYMFAIGLVLVVAGFSVMRGKSWHRLPP